MTQDVSAPDWDTITETIRCPLCEYELRGLSEPRCPECGYRFTWPELFAAARDRSHPYLFELHRKRNIRSFIRTKLATFVPWTFWRTLRPDMEGSRARLILYWLIPLPLLLLLALGDFAQLYFSAAKPLQANRQRALAQFQRSIAARDPYGKWVLTQFGSAQKAVDATNPSPYTLRFIQNLWGSYWQRSASRQSQRYIASIIVIACWPWLTFAALLIFRTTMHRAKVKSIHVLRCAIYSSDVMFVAGAIVFALQLFDPTGTSGRPPPPAPYWQLQPPIAFPTWMVWGTIAASTMAVLTTVGLSISYRFYLRFPQPFLTAALSQVVATVASATVLGLSIQF